jgi:hypothetical protein
VSGENKPRFDAALPAPYSDDWRRAERAGSGEAPRLAGYQAPGADIAVFVLEEFSFRGGQSMDTAEYPFNGLWSNDRLNEKPQTLRIKGYIRDRRGGRDEGAVKEKYIKTRNALVEALRVPTGDETPGYIDLPFWGRFPVVVDSYDVSEKTNEKGQCGVSIDFTRAGASPESRAAAQSDAGAAAESDVDAAVKETEKAVIAAFQEKLGKNTDANTLMAGFGKIKGVLLGALGRVRAAQTKIDAIAAEINGITDLIAQGIRAPGELARAALNAVMSVAAKLIEIKNAAMSYGSGNDGGDEDAGTYGGAVQEDGGASGSAVQTRELSDAASYPAPVYNNEKNALLYFLSANDYAMDIPAVTPAQRNTKEAVENLYRAGALCAASQIIIQIDLSYRKADGYWNLMAKLEESVDKNNPAVFTAIENLRVSVSRVLSAKELSAERKAVFDAPLPLLYIANYLGCDEAKLRELNDIADSFTVKGGLVYV